MDTTPQNCPFPWAHLDPIYHMVSWPTWVSLQIAPRSVQVFLQGWQHGQQTEWLTDTQTDGPHYSVCSNSRYRSLLLQCSLKFHRWLQRWKKFDNPSAATDEVLGNSVMACFLTHRVEQPVLASSYILPVNCIYSVYSAHTDWKRRVYYSNVVRLKFSDP